MVGDGSDKWATTSPSLLNITCKTIARVKFVILSVRQ